MWKREEPLRMATTLSLIVCGPARGITEQKTEEDQPKSPLATVPKP